MSPRICSRLCSLTLRPKRSIAVLIPREASVAPMPRGPPCRWRLPSWLGDSGRTPWRRVGNDNTSGKVSASRRLRAAAAIAALHGTSDFSTDGLLACRLHGKKDVDAIRGSTPKANTVAAAEAASSGRPLYSKFFDKSVYWESRRVGRPATLADVRRGYRRVRTAAQSANA